MQALRLVAVLAGGLLLFAGTSAAQGIYKWVDESGKVHFGDRPSEGGAEKLDLKKTRDPGSAGGPPPYDSEACAAFLTTAEFAGLPQSARAQYKNGCIRTTRERLEANNPTPKLSPQELRRRANNRASSDGWLGEDFPEIAPPAKPRSRFGRGAPTAAPTPMAWPDPMQDESYCQATYGKSCSELENWRATAVEKCERMNRSQGCDDAAYIERSRPLTREQLRQKDQIKDERYRQRMEYERARGRRNLR